MSDHLEIELQCIADSPSPTSGVTLHSRALANSLAAQGHRVRVVTSVPDAFPHCEAIQGRGVHARTPLGRAWRRLEHRFTRVPPGGRSLPLVIYASQTEPVPRRPNATQVLIVHDVMPLAFPRHYLRSYAYYRFLLPRVVERVDAVVTRTRFTAQELSTRLGIDESRMHVIKGGIQEFPPDRGGLDGSAQGRPYLVYVGNAFPHKNVHRLLRAFALCGSRETHDLVLAGPIGPRHARPLRKLAALQGIDHAVRIDAFPTVVRLSRLLRHAAALVQPSLYEGFGMTPLEAMRMGVPVAASRIPAHSEVCQDAVEYFDPQSPPHMAAAIDRVVSDAGVRSRLLRSSRSVAAACDWTTAANEYVRLLRDLSGRRTGSS